MNLTGETQQLPIARHLAPKRPASAHRTASGTAGLAPPRHVALEQSASAHRTPWRGIAIIAVAACGEYLGAMHELTTTTPDFVCWAVTLLLVAKLLERRDPRWWLAIGTSIGVASEAKWNIAFLAAALAAGFLATEARGLLRSRYLLAGCVIAAALAAPDLIWQAAHGWPSMD